MAARRAKLVRVHCDAALPLAVLVLPELRARVEPSRWWCTASTGRYVRPDADLEPPREK